MDPLSQLNDRLTILRDRVRGVALNHNNGFYLYGPPGTSKTYTVKKTLAELGVNYEYFSGHLTAGGFLAILDEHCDRTIVLDDVTQIFQNKIACQYFLAALGTQPDDRSVRLVRYVRQGHDEFIRFTGGIIAISNLELDSHPVLDAIQSRVHCLKYAPTDEQMAAMMFDVSAKGWTSPKGKMTPQECTEVAKFLIHESQRLNLRLDMRLLLDKSFPDYLQDRVGDAESHWKDLILSTLERHVVSLKHTVAESKTRQQTKMKEHDIIRQILAEFPDRDQRVAAWKERTSPSKSERAFYRRLDEMDV